MTSPKPPQGQRVFTCGHSFHYFIIPLLTQMARAAGIHDHAEVGGSPIGGSWVRQHWEVPEDKNQAKAALRAAAVDVLTVSPIWLPDTGIQDFATLAAAHNPQVRVLVQQFWMPNDEYNPTFPLDTRKPVDHNAATPTALAACHQAYLNDIQAEAIRINTSLGRRVVLVVPVGQAVVALRKRVIQATAPGIATQAELFTDSWGHPTQPIQVLAAYCHFAAIYGQSPAGLPVAAEMLQPDRPGWADPKLTRLLQDLAWEALTHEPANGVGAK